VHYARQSGGTLPTGGMTVRQAEYHLNAAVSPVSLEHAREVVDALVRGGNWSETQKAKVAKLMHHAWHRRLEVALDEALDELFNQV
jgi:hypothetical protein